MAKEFIDELIEALKEQKETEVNEFYDKLDEGELPKLPMSPLSVTKTFYRIALKHKVTKDELAAVLSMTEPTPADLKNLREFSDQT